MKKSSEEMLQDLAREIGEMLVRFNKDLAYDEANRVGAIQLILARPEEQATKEKPTSIYVTTEDFTHKNVEKGAPSLPTFKYGPVTVTYSFSPSGPLQCCAPNWVGVYDSQGGLHGCFPFPACGNYTGPIRCSVPG